MKKPVGVIALLTDVGECEPYSASIKGVILNLCLRAHIIDISNSIPSFDINEAAYILLTAYEFFPPGTIFIVVVVPGVGDLERPLLIITRNYYFVGPDNGVLIPAASSDEIEEIFLLNKNEYYFNRHAQTFHGRDIYASIAARLICGNSIDSLGELIDKDNIIDMRIDFNHKILTDYMELKILHIDKYGNIVLSEKFNRFVEDFNFVIGKQVKVYCNEIEAIAVLEKSFSHVPKGSLILYENSYGLLELAVNQGSAQKLLHAKQGDIVRIFE